MPKPPYHWIFKIPKNSVSLINEVTAAVKSTPGVTFRPKQPQEEMMVIGADVDFDDSGAELMLRLRLPGEFNQYLSSSPNWSAG